MWAKLKGVKIIYMEREIERSRDIDVMMMMIGFRPNPLDPNERALEMRKETIFLFVHNLST